MTDPTIKNFSPLENTPENNRNIPPKIQKSNQNPRVASTASPTITIQESMTMSQNDQSQNNGQLVNDNNQNHTQNLVIGLDKALSHRTRSLATNATIGGNSHTHDIEVIGFDDHEILSHESKSGLIQINSSTVAAVPIPVVPATTAIVVDNQNSIVDNTENGSSVHNTIIPNTANGKNSNGNSNGNGHHSSISHHTTTVWNGNGNGHHSQSGNGHNGNGNGNGNGISGTGHSSGQILNSVNGNGMHQINGHSNNGKSSSQTNSNENVNNSNSNGQEVTSSNENSQPSIVPLPTSQVENGGTPVNAGVSQQTTAIMTSFGQYNNKNVHINPVQANLLTTTNNGVFLPEKLANVNGPTNSVLAQQPQNNQNISQLPIATITSPVNNSKAKEKSTERRSSKRSRKNIDATPDPTGWNTNENQVALHNLYFKHHENIYAAGLNNHSPNEHLIDENTESGDENGPHYNMGSVDENNRFLEFSMSNLDVARASPKIQPMPASPKPAINKNNTYEMNQKKGKSFLDAGAETELTYKILNNGIDADVKAILDKHVKKTLKKHLPEDAIHLYDTEDRYISGNSDVSEMVKRPYPSRYNLGWDQVKLEYYPGYEDADGQTQKERISPAENENSGISPEKTVNDARMFKFYSQLNKLLINKQDLLSVNDHTETPEEDESNYHQTKINYNPVDNQYHGFIVLLQTFLREYADILEEKFSFEFDGSQSQSMDFQKFLAIPVSKVSFFDEKTKDYAERLVDSLMGLLS